LTTRSNFHDLLHIDLWVREYNEAGPHQGRWCFGKTPMQTFVCNADDQGEDDRSLTASDTKTRVLAPKSGWTEP
jgi:hypothetical protein